MKCGKNHGGLRGTVGAGGASDKAMVPTDVSQRPPVLPSGQVVVAPPPDLPKRPPANPTARVLPLAMLAAMAGMVAVYVTSGTSFSRSPMFLILPAMMTVSLIGTLAYGSRGAGRTAEINEQRAGYLRYLDTLHAALSEAAHDQHRYLHWAHPDPAALWALAGGDRMWERIAGHPEFGTVRIGRGSGPCTTTVVVPDVDSDTADPVTVDAVAELLRARSVVADIPVLLPLTSTRHLTVDGDPGEIRAAARAVVCQLAMLHGPDAVGIGAQLGDIAAHEARDARQAWDWLKWLPHLYRTGATGHRLIIVDGASPPEREAGVTAVVLRPGDRGAPVTMHADGAALTVACDGLSLPDALACARQIARYATSVPDRQRTSANPDWPMLMGIDDPESAVTSWGANEALLAVPVGVADDGSAVRLDVKEAAAGGMGPHGLCVGATGSGKSEFLRTLTLGMMTAHSPETLNLVLVDFKGGATFLGMENARHVSAVITNLADEAPLVARMREALSGEVNRRQEILRAAGNVTSVAEYRRARANDPSLAPLPALLIVVDEFSELLSQHPDFIEVFVAIGRLGRSLGIHLLLASQRLDEGRLRGLDTHLSYRICLKTFSASESRAVLGVPDAYHLAPQPGVAYLKTADGRMTRFQTAFVSGRYSPAPRRRPVRAAQRFTLVDELTLRHDPGDPCRDLEPLSKPLLEVVLRALAGRGPAAHRVWLPPLDCAPALRALSATDSVSHLKVSIGLVDRPFEQRYAPLIVDLSGSAGHVAVVGAPQSGKSTTVQTLVTALAATHDPARVQFYCLDFGGGALTGLAALPHVGSVATRTDAELCRRTVAVLESVLRTREARLRALGLGSFAEYRRSVEAGRDGEPYGDVFLVVDGWAVLRQEFDGLDTAITALAAQGLAYGVHVVITASRWAELRPALKDQIATRIELRLGDPAESEMDRRRARDLADRPPGRGLTRAGQEMVIAQPDVAAVAHPRSGCAARPIELLPSRVDSLAIAAPTSRSPGEVVLGVGERDLTAVTLDLDRQPHLLVLGEGECGKTAALRLLCTELMRTRDAEQVQLEIVDYRRGLLGVVQTGHLAGYSVSDTALTARVAALSTQLQARMPDENVTQSQLRDRSWWNGPDIYLVVDDYDLVAGATGNPLTPLADFLPHAKDLGLHLIVARRSGGAARAMFDPLLARLRDLGCSGLMMSASPDEGVLLGTGRPGPQPPGRGTLLVRGRSDELIQVGWVQPP